MRKKVLAQGLVPVTDRWEEQPDAAMLNEMQNELKNVADVEARRPATVQEWTTAVKGVNVIIGETRVDENFLKHAEKLEMIQFTGIGYDMIDVDACTRKGVIVCNVAEIYSEPTAQHALALILDVTKHVTRADRAMRAGTWQKQDWMGFQLWGRTLEVIGLGAIGARVAMKGRLAFGMRVLGYDPYVLPERGQLYGVEMVSLDKLLKESDVITTHVPLTKQTRHLIGENELHMMKKSVFFINTCRGAAVDEKALIRHLQDGSIRAAGLDVTEIEPLPNDSHLLKMENVVLTPHIASSTTEAVEDTYRGAVANVIRFLQGQRPRWMVNPDAYNQTSE